MDHDLRALGLRLSYLRGKRVIGAVRSRQLFDDLLDGTPTNEALVWAARPALSEYDHLVLASDLETGVALGMLGAHDHSASAGPFIWLESGFVADVARGNNLLRRMIALMLLRIIAFGDMPVAVAAVTHNPIAAHVLREMTPHLSQVRFAPSPDGQVTDLAAVMLTRDVTTALGQRFAYARVSRTITAGLAVVQGGAPARAGQPAHPLPLMASMLAMLDLRKASEAELIRDLRSLYRSKGRRATRAAHLLDASLEDLAVS